MILWSFGNVPAQIKRYQTIARWFLKDSYWRFRKHLIAIFALSAISLALQLAALGLLFVYIRGLESGGAFGVAGRTFDPQSSLGLLLAVAGGLLVLFASSYVLSHIATLQTLSFGRRYEELCGTRAIRLVGAHGDRPELRHWQPLLSRLVGYGRLCGRVARSAIGLSIAAATFLATFIVLLWLDAPVTFILALLFLLISPAIYYVNVRAAHYSLAMEEIAPMAGAEKRAIIADISSGQIDPFNNMDEIDRRFRAGAIRSSLDYYIGRLRTIAESGLITSLMAGFAIFIILLYKGSEILSTGTGWSVLITYFIALRFNLGSVIQGAQAVTSINRFYPYLSRYVRFVMEVQALAPESSDAIAVPSADGPEQTIEWRLEQPRPGDLVGLVAPDAAPLSVRRTAIASALGLDQADVGFVAINEEAGKTIRAACGFSQEVRDKDLTRALRRLRLDSLLPDGDGVCLEATIDAFAKAAHWPRLRAGLGFIAASRKGHRAVIVEEALWRELSPDQQKAALKLLGEASLAIAYRSVPANSGKWGEQFMILTNAQGLLAWVDSACAGQLGAKLKRLIPATEPPVSPAGEDEEEGDSGF